MNCHQATAHLQQMSKKLKGPFALALSLALSGGLNLLPFLTVVETFGAAYAGQPKTEHAQPLTPVAQADLSPMMDDGLAALMLLEDGKSVFEPMAPSNQKMKQKAHAKKKATVLTRVGSVGRKLKNATADKSASRHKPLAANRKNSAELVPIDDLGHQVASVRHENTQAKLSPMDDAFLALQKLLNNPASNAAMSPAAKNAIALTQIELPAKENIPIKENMLAHMPTKSKTVKKTASKKTVAHAKASPKFLPPQIIANGKPMRTMPVAKASGVEESYNLLSSNILNNLEEVDKPSAMPRQMPSSGKTASLPPLMRPVRNDAELESGVKVLRSGVSSTTNEIDVTVNKAVILNLSQPAARVSISNPEIASIVVISPTQLQLIGNQVGVANLLVWADTRSSEHTIVDVQVHRDVSVLSRQLRFVDSGIQVVPLAAEDSVILTGEADNRESAQLAVDLAKAFFKGGGGAATPGGGGGKGVSGPSSASPGSALPGAMPNIINLINIKGEPSTKIELARQKLKAIDKGIELDIVPGSDGTEKAILSGKVRTASMISKAINTASVFYGQPGIKVITGPGGNSVRAAAGNNNFPGSDAFNDNLDINVLQGSVMTDNSGNVISMLEVSQKPQIKCSIQFIEISKSNLDALGSAIFGAGERFSWANLSGAQSTPSGRSIATLDQDNSGSAWANTYNPLNNTRTSSMSSGFSQNLSSGITQAFSVNQKFTAAISALEEKRKARTLAEPNLTLLSGEKASFLAGGEVPIPVLGGNGQVNVTYHEFGIRLNLVATYLDNGKIHMLVAPEISSVDPTNGVSTASISVPGFRTRRMQSTLELEHGQSFVLAGLYNQDEVWSLSKLPGAGSIPILGSLMRNKWKTNNRTELIVIIRPEVTMIDADPSEPAGYPLPTSQSQSRPEVTPVAKRVDIAEPDSPGPGVGDKTMLRPEMPKASN